MGRILSHSLKGIMKFAKMTWAAVMDNKPLLLILVLVSYTLFSQLETAHTYGGHMGGNHGHFSTLAKAILSHGIIETKFGQPMLDQGGNIREYYINHPPLLTLYIALSFMLLVPLGMSYTAAATLVPTLFSLGSLTILYLICKRLWGVKVAFLSTGVMALTPMFRSYSQLVCHEPLCIFIILSAVYFYILWMESKKEGYFKVVCGLIVVGCFTGWPVYYLIPLMASHYLIFSKKRDVKKILVLPLIGLVMFSLFIVHVYILEGNTSFEKLIKHVKNRTDYNDKTDPWPWRHFKIFVGYMGDIIKANTPYVFYASGLMFTTVAYKLYRKQSILNESYVLMLLLLAVIHNLLWPGGVGFHNYWSYYFTPALAIASIVGINSVLEGDREYLKFVFWTVVAILWVNNNNEFIK
ncbi:MAG: glycosyltransferase family 39 protein [Candidatus Altiarchaeota archaeon]